MHAANVDISIDADSLCLFWLQHDGQNSRPGMSSLAASPAASSAASQQAKLLAAQREVQSLRVAQAEVSTMKPGKTVYEQQNGVWFLSNPQATQEHLKTRLAKAEKEVKLAEINART